jgi:hypothetical protein
MVVAWLTEAGLAIREHASGTLDINA